jgi:hypothetical protein
VAQLLGTAGLEALAVAPGPALAGVFEPTADGVVPFVHDPLAGDSSWQRLSVQGDLDALGERISSTRWKDRRWAEDLAHLVALAGPPSVGEGPEPTEARAEEPTGADRLAAWLLAQTDLSEAETGA